MEDRAVATNLFQLIFAGEISSGEDIEEVKKKILKHIINEFEIQLFYF